jgi:CheY-like chemotaxis protein
MSHTVCKMLVADDTPAIFPIFRHAAAQAATPIEVIEVDDGRGCLERLGRGDIDLAFIDVFMPQLSGLQALRNARFVGNKTFVTLMSGRPDERLIELARELNAYEFLTKPFRLSDVAAIVRTFERARAPMRVLIVDDSQTVRSVIRRVLERSIFRIEIVEAGDGATALARCREEQFDVVFLDFNMPWLNGMETLEHIRRHGTQAHVVMIASERNETRERRALAQGAEAFLHKPFYPVHVDALIHSIYGLRSPTLTILKAGVLEQFDVRIIGRTVAVAHKDSGHVYEYLWFREAPHLRSTHIRPNEAALVQAGVLREQAERVAMLELKTARLLS